MDNKQGDIIQAVEQCLRRNGCSSCENCPYTNVGDGFECREKLRDDIIALLKAQEPRVMALEEVNAMDWDYCYLEEERLPGKVYRSTLGKHALTCVTWPSITTAKNTHGCDGYGKTWRCWTSSPDEKVRADTPWQ